MIEPVILDTGPLVAYLDRDERHNEWCCDQFRQIRPSLLTCEAVLSEACFLLQAQPRAIARIAEFCERNLIEVRFKFDEHRATVFRLIEKYANVPMSFADACLVCMAEQIPSARVLTLDKDFTIFRLPNRRLIPTLLPD